LNVGKVLLLAKRTRVHAEKRVGQAKKWHKNYTKKHEMASLTLLAVLCNCKAMAYCVRKLQMCME